MLSLHDDRPAASALPWLAVLFALGAWLGRVDLLTPDEARHAEIAREMFLHGNWLTPRIYGEAYYDKPALFYWLIGSSLAAFGNHSWAARLPSVLAALFAVAMTWAWARQAWGRTAGRWTVLLLGTTLFFVAVGRYVVVDMLLTAALTGALAWMGLLLLEEDGARRRPRWPLYACTAAGVMAKGPVALVLVAGVAVVAALFERRPKLLIDLGPFSGLLLVLLIAAPWYAGAYLTDPTYIKTFLWHHNFARYAVPGALEHQEPWYFYLVALPVALLPWSIFLPAALAAAWSSSNRGFRHALAWATVIVGFFSFSQTKLPTYVLAAFPPLVTLVAAYIDDLVARGAPLRRSLEAAAVSWTLLAAVIAVGGAVWIVVTAPESWWRAAIGVPTVAIAVWAYRRIHQVERLMLAVAGSCLGLVATVYGAASDAVNARESQRGAARFVAASLSPSASLASYRVAPHALAFYAGREIRRAADADAAVPELLAGAESALLTKSKFLAELGLDPLPGWMKVAWSSGDGHVLIVAGRDVDETASRDSHR